MFQSGRIFERLFVLQDQNVDCGKNKHPAGGIKVVLQRVWTAESKVFLCFILIGIWSLSGKVSKRGPASYRNLLKMPSCNHGVDKEKEKTLRSNKWISGEHDLFPATVVVIWILSDGTGLKSQYKHEHSVSLYIVSPFPCVFIVASPHYSFTYFSVATSIFIYKFNTSTEKISCKMILRWFFAAVTLVSTECTGGCPGRFSVQIPTPLKWRWSVIKATPLYLQMSRMVVYKH